VCSTYGDHCNDDNDNKDHHHHTTTGTTLVSQCQKRTSGLYGAREDLQRQTQRPSGWTPLHPD